MTDTPMENILSGDGEAVSAQDQEVDTPADNESQDEGEHAGQKMVPKAALDEARGKAKRYTEQVADFERRFKESEQAWERRFNVLVDSLRPKQEPPKQPDFYEDPVEAIKHTVTSAVAPEIERINKQFMEMTRETAAAAFGADKVQEAEAAFMSAVHSKQIDPADFHKVVNSSNRYAAAVKWFQQKSLLSEIGDDPAAYRAKIEAEVLAKLKSGVQDDNAGGSPASNPPPVMPSNLAGMRSVGSRSGPAWAGPLPLADIFKR